MKGRADLLLNSRIPPGVHEEDIGRRSQVESHAAGLEGHQEDPDVGVVREGMDHSVPVIHAHAALQPHAAHAYLHVSHHTRM